MSAEDRERYDKQLVCVNKILAVFENKTYDDANAEDKAKVLELMNEVCRQGLLAISVLAQALLDAIIRHATDRGHGQPASRA